MNDRTDVDQVIAAWLRDEAQADAPAYLQETLDLLARAPQRRLGAGIHRRLPEVPRLVARPPRVLQLAVLMLLIILALVASLILVGSRPRLPSPVGLAGNGLVAYSDGEDIFLVDKEGHLFVTDLHGLGAESNPTFSPDGTQIAFFSRDPRWRPDSAQRLFVGPSDGSAPAWDITGTLVVWNPNPNDADAAPAWSPDGTRIAYTGLDIPSGAVGIVVASVETGSSDFVARGSARSSYTKPRWSPDGRWISYRAEEPGEVTGTALMLVRGDGGDGFTSSEVTRSQVSSDSFNSLAWSPDSTRVAYARRDSVELGEFRIAVYDIAQGKETPIGRSGVRAFQPIWSTDGASLAYLETAGAGGVPFLVVVDPTGANERRLGVVVDCDISWSPDSRFIIGYALGCQDGLVIIPVADPGAEITRLPAPAAFGPISWQRVAP